MENLEIQQPELASDITTHNRRVEDRRESPDQEEALWRWTNMLLNGNERRSGDERRRLAS
ncbi:hypothetical protein [Chitiniphilus eburneus]|uniref:Uncharacterized protein n=1 Tax=Chitiniphilus eburneus TaxID=2571148 RepID=A0A4U0PY43_9NEIS|nr:hypothetical protein [Chitiniphilus eburneus]TJZ73487.1 hypothetical protein FAZ21_09840 [Chitiniphilus eburneus]